MAERDPIQQLDQAVDLFLAGQEPSLEGTGQAERLRQAELLKMVHDLRHMPAEDFRARLKTELLEQARKERSIMTATETRHWIPKGLRAVTPYLHPKSATELIDFMTKAFGAEEIARYAGPGGRIMHAQVKIGDTILEMGEPDQPQPAALHIFVPDTEETYRQALKAGARSLVKPTDSYFDQRLACIWDPSGNMWLIGTQKTGGHVPEGLATVTPYLHPRGTPELIEFLKKAFDAEEVMRIEHGGAIRHARVRIGDSIVEMSEIQGEHQPMAAAFHLFVPDTDAVYQRAIEAGAVSLGEPQDRPYGERSGFVKDPFGFTWYIATRNAGE
jgi:PhnB protein